MRDEDEDEDRLWRIAYVSRARRPFSGPELRLLLERSRRHNRDRGVTGLLVHIGGCFFQVLEGERGAVAETYGRIATDPRHHEVTTLIDGPLAARQFGDWAMACFEGDGSLGCNVPILRRLVAGFAQGGCAGPAVVSALLLEFRQQLTRPG